MSNVNLEYGNGKKPGTNFDYVPENKQVGISSGVKTYWTNFEKDPELRPKEWYLSQTPVADFWSFKTNITWEDLSKNWDDKRRNRFLHQMWEIYRYRKAS